MSICVNHKLLLLILSGLTLSQVVAQQQAELDRLADKINRQVETKKPEWKHRRGEPIQGSSNVYIEFWSSSNRIVKVAIVPYNSPEHAREVFRGFAKFESQKEELKGFGDSAYGWGYALSNVVFTRGKLIIYVSSYAQVDSDPDASSLTEAARGERERSEMRRLSREFAIEVLRAVDLLEAL